MTTLKLKEPQFKIIQNTLATQRPESCVCCPNMWTGIVFSRKKGKQQQAAAKTASQSTLLAPIAMEQDVKEFRQQICKTFELIASGNGNVNRVQAVYSAVLPPSLMVFFVLKKSELRSR